MVEGDERDKEIKEKNRNGEKRGGMNYKDKRRRNKRGLKEVE